MNSCILFAWYTYNTNYIMWPWKEKSNWEKIKQWVYDNDRYVMTGGIMAALILLSRPRYWRRIIDAESIPVHYMKKQKTITGIVSRVGDGDGFHLYHVPFWHKFFPLPQKLPQKQISVRVAGVDAPECAHFGMPEQPYGKEAKEFLQKEILGKTVTIQVLKRDQYGRIVAMPWLKRTFKWENISEMLLKEGLATVYIGAGAEYGNMLKRFQYVEKVARKSKVGMWKSKASHKESPMEFKKRTKGE